jgi:hypothetical protein
MTSNTTAATSGRSEGSKRTWTAPNVEILDIRAALGAKVGPLCDKFGSLSHGTTCP